MKKAIIVLSLLSVCMAATAQESVPDSTDVFYKHLQINEIVVTGLAGDTKMKEMPAPVSVVRPADLAARAGGNIIDAIAAEPGLSEITTGGGIAKPVIRGMGYNRVVVVNEGIRQEGQQWGDEHGIEIDGASVHSVEILKGPASLMYGSDALAGILVFHPEPLFRQVCPRLPERPQWPRGQLWLPGTSRLGDAGPERFLGLFPTSSQLFPPDPGND